MKLLSYLGFLALCYLLFHSAQYVFKAEEITLNEEALQPDLYLSNTKFYAQDHAYNRSLKHLDNAIKSIQNIKQELDEESNSNIALAIDQLNYVYEEIRKDSLSYHDMDEAFSTALNALSYAEIKVSEHYFESHETEKARLALTYGQLHIQNALKFMQGADHEYETHIYAEIDSLIANKSLSNDEIIDKLESMLSELDSLALN